MRTDNMLEFFYLVVRPDTFGDRCLKSRDIYIVVIVEVFLVVGGTADGAETLCDEADNRSG